MKPRDGLTAVSATFQRETCANGEQVTTVAVGQFRMEMGSAFQMPTILSALRLSEADEAQVIAAVNRFETITVEGKTCVSDLRCAGFAARAGEMARLQAGVRAKLALDRFGSRHSGVYRLDEQICAGPRSSEVVDRAGELAKAGGA